MKRYAMISLAALLVIAAVLSIRFFRVEFKKNEPAVIREDEWMDCDDGTYGAVPSVTMYPVTGGKVFIEGNRTNIIHFMYLEHLGGTDVEITDENRAQFDILQNLYERYGGENLSIFTIMIPSCCLPPYDTFLHLVYDRDAVKWPVIIDDDYELYMAFEDHLSPGWDFLSRDPTLIFVNGDGSIASVTEYQEFDVMVTMLDGLVYGEAT